MIATSRSHLLSPVLRRFAGQGLFVLAAAGAAVMVLTADEYRAPAQAAATQSETLITWSSAIAPDGKLQQRHGGQPQERDLAQLFTASVPAGTAAQTMPLTLDWSGSAFEPQMQPAPRQPATRAARAHAPDSVKLAVARPEWKRDVTANREPLVIRPLEQAALQREDAPGVFASVTKPVTATVARATGLVTDAASAVGAAGSWTLSQAAGLLPRF